MHRRIPPTAAGVRPMTNKLPISTMIARYLSKAERCRLATLSRAVSPLRGTQLPNRWAQHPTLPQTLQYIGCATQSVTAIAAGRITSPSPLPIAPELPTCQPAAAPDAPPAGPHGPRAAPSTSSSSTAPMAQTWLRPGFTPDTHVVELSLPDFLAIRKTALAEAGAAVTQSARAQLEALQRVTRLETRQAEASRAGGTPTPQMQADRAAPRALAGLLNARNHELTRASKKHEEDGATLAALAFQNRMYDPAAIAACDRCGVIIPATHLPACRAGTRSLALLHCPTCSAAPSL